MENNQTKDIYFIGDVAMDEYYSIEEFPNKGSKAIVHSLGNKMGGMIANAACIFNQLSEANTHFFTALNSSEGSKILCRNLESQGIDTSLMVWDDTLPDSKTIIFLSGDDNAVFIPTLDIQKIEISENIYHKLLNSSCIYSTFCEIKSICYNSKNIFTILEETQKNGSLFFCDLDVADINKNELNLLNCVDILFVNETGYNNLQNLISKNIDCEIFNYGIKALVITKGSKGCKVITPEITEDIEGIKVQVVDVTGAGDTFCSSFMYKYLQNKDVVESAKFANVAGAMAVSQMGARVESISDKTITDFL